MLVAPVVPPGKTVSAWLRVTSLLVLMEMTEAVEVANVLGEDVER
jgi:hypothetical protein